MPTVRPSERRINNLGRAASGVREAAALVEENAQRLAKSANVDPHKYRRAIAQGVELRKLADKILRLRDREVQRAVLAGELPDLELRKIGTDRERWGLDVAAAEIGRLHAGRRS